MPENESNTSGSVGGNSTRPQINSSLDESKLLEHSARSRQLVSGPAEQIATLSEDDLNLANLDSIGRFHLIGQLGSGGFGTVFQGYDPQLKRKVAIKVPRRKVRLNRTVWKNFIDEARVLAEFDHPAVVRVHDVGELENGLPFVVMEFIHGVTLREFAEQKQLSPHDKLRLMIQIAEGLQYVHNKGIIHCDLKPSNVMIDNENKPCITDFGLALRTDDALKKVNTIAMGTLCYMSPEQIRGENHRLDARTDIWAFGVILYWLFGDKLPFYHTKSEKTSKQICNAQPLQLSKLCPNLPDGLSRICDRCIAKSKLDRYANVGDLIDELRQLLFDLPPSLNSMLKNERPDAADAGRHATKTQRLGLHVTSFGQNQPKLDQINHAPSQPIAKTGTDDEATIQVQAKGLRSFDENDSEFFLQLLSGPKDYRGVPDSIRFWINWATHSKAEALGVIYGPSGSGKSSFVKAGLVPRLPARIDCIYLDPTHSTIEDQLSAQLSKRLALPDDSPDSLLEKTNAIRRQNRLNGGEKTLIVIDQLEQWLCQNSLDEAAQLVLALRQCDGINLQCLFLVRDDFWMPLQQLFGLLDSALNDGKNSSALPLLRCDEAQRILGWFGDNLNAFPDSQTAEQRAEFLRLAIDCIQVNNRVLPAHLTLLTEMMQRHDWNIEQIRQPESWQDVGVKHLEQLFGRASEHHPDSGPIQAVLKLLLPHNDSTIKGSSKTKAEIVETLSTTFDSEQLDRTINLLDQRLKLITRHDSDDWECNESERTLYQLSHDIMVAPTREWLRQKQNETWQGRAASRLADLSERWNQDRHDRYLPTLSEYAQIVAGVSWSQIGDQQQTLMSRVTRYYWTRGFIVMALFSAVFAWYFIASEAQIQRAVKSRLAQFVAEEDVVTARQLVASLDGNSLPVLKKTNRASSYDSPRQKFRYVIAQAELSQPSQISIEQLLSSIPDTSPEEMPWLVEMLIKATHDQPQRMQAASTFLHSANNDAKKNGSKKQSLLLRTKFGVASMHLGDMSILNELLLANGSDPVPRTIAMHHMLSFEKDASKIAEQVSLPLSDATLTALLAALSLEAKRGINQKTLGNKNELLVKVTSILSGNSPNRLIANAKHFLFANGISGTELKDTIGTDFVRRTIAGGQHTFAKIPAGSIKVHDPTLSAKLIKETRSLPTAEIKEPRQLTIDSDFWIAESEVTRKQYQLYSQTFGTDELTNARNGPGTFDLNAPVLFVTQYRAMHYCNWLSKQAGLKPCYDFDESILDDLANMDGVPVHIAQNSNGFRIPNRFQLEYASRAGSGLKFDFGSGEYQKLLTFHAVISATGLGPVESVYSRIPNAFGLFGTVGNANEWTGDIFRNTGVFTNYRGYVYGGGVAEGNECWQGFTVAVPSNNKYFGKTGFRLMLPSIQPLQITR